MISTVTSAEAVIGIAAIGGFLFIIYGPWQWVCADIARQILFEKRDAIFDLAADGKLSFTSREYQVIRSAMQSSIRFAHELTLSRFFVMYVFMTRRGMFNQKSDLRQAIEKILDPEIRKTVEWQIDWGHRAMLLTMVARSPIALFLAALFVPVLLAFALLRRQTAKAMALQTGELIQVEAENVERETPLPMAA